ncbi:MAG: hypothetical protein ABIA76_06070 [Candidatus Diapherotrites archaeon]
MARPRTVPVPERRTTFGRPGDRLGEVKVKAYKFKILAFGENYASRLSFEKIKRVAVNPLDANRELFEEVADHAQVRAGDINSVYVPKKKSPQICVVTIRVGPDRKDIRYLRITDFTHFNAILGKANAFRNDRKNRKNYRI